MPGLDRLVAFGARLRAIRLALRLTQQDVATRIDRSQAYVSLVERGRLRGLGIADADRLCSTLGAALLFGVDPPVIMWGDRQRDAVHARCVAYVARRLKAAGWLVQREVQVGEARRPGWIDLLAFDPNHRTLLVIEVKTALVDLGGLERQLGWYQREALRAARQFGWSAAKVQAGALLLATGTNDVRIRDNADGINQAFPGRWRDLLAVLRGGFRPASARAIAMVDPSSKARTWVRPTVLDGRRMASPYRTSADALRRPQRGPLRRHTPTAPHEQASCDFVICARPLSNSDAPAVGHA